MTKRGRIEERLKMLDRNLADAVSYLARGVNVEGSCWLHLDDWRGRSGHPDWIRNHMIPATERMRDRDERTLEQIRRREQGKALRRRRKRIRPRAAQTPMNLIIEARA